VSVSSWPLRDFFAWQQQYINSPTMIARTSTPPPAPPAMAAMGGPSFADAVASAASFVAEGAVEVLDVVAVDRVLDALVELALELDARTVLLLELDAPPAPYACRRASESSIAGARKFAEQPPAAHGFVLQHPMKVLLANIHV
jgi:hypothetical protein